MNSNLEPWAEELVASSAVVLHLPSGVVGAVQRLVPAGEPPTEGAQPLTVPVLVLDTGDSFCCSRDTLQVLTPREHQYHQHVQRLLGMALVEFGAIGRAMGLPPERLLVLLRTALARQLRAM